jgi:hypothetical protein
MEHGRWMQEKLAAGWTLGEEDRVLKKDPHLVPMEELAPEVAEVDRIFVRAIPEMLAAVGLEIVDVAQRASRYPECDLAREAPGAAARFSVPRNRVYAGGACPQGTGAPAAAARRKDLRSRGRHPVAQSTDAAVSVADAVHARQQADRCRDRSAGGARAVQERSAHPA